MTPKESELAFETITEGDIPELTRVIIAYKEQIVMEETLDAGLVRLFGDGTRKPDPPEVERVSAPGPGAAGGGDTERADVAPASEAAALAAEARGHYDRAIQAQRAGDWAKYGEELRLLGEVLERMRPR